MKLRQVDSVPNFFLDHDSGIYYTKKMVNGRVVWRTTGHTARKSALRRHYEIMNQLNDAKSGWDKKKVPTLEAFWTKEYRQRKQLAKRSWDTYKSLMKNHLLPQFGRAGLDEISRGQVERYLNWRLKKAAAASVKTEQALLTAVLEMAVEDELLLKNPLHKLAPPAVQGRERVLSLGEQDTLLGALPPLEQDWMTFMLGTGLRITESLTLRADDVDWATRQLRVLGKGSKRRYVPIMASMVEDVLRERLEVTKTRLWPHVRNTYWKALNRAVEETGIKGISPHTLRHTFATRYLQGGGDIYVLSKILGHASVRVTEKTYAHLLPADHARLSENIDLGLTRGVVEEPVEPKQARG